VVIEVTDAGFLPPAVDCADGTLCQAALNALWERTILNTRQITCLRRKLDALYTQQPPEVPFFSSIGPLAAPPLSPFGQAPSTVKAFGQGLTFEEASALARHPYVESLWTAAGIQFGPSPPPGCPPDLTSPIPGVDCPVDREPITGKISDADRTALAAASGPVGVLVRVRGGAVICQLPPCSAQPCPERERIVARWTDQNLASQLCVRELIAGLGGKSDPTSTWLIDSFEATLTWDQIQTVAAHPHVASIESKIGGGPPPP
jgi:hypothetical protein